MNDDNNGWHLDKRVSVGHIVTTAIVAVSLVFWMSRIESRTIQNAVEIAATQSRLDRIETRNQSALDDIRRALGRIEAKLDGKKDK